MTGAPRLLLGLGGLVVLAGMALAALRAESPPAAAATLQPAACSSCDARHARLRQSRALQTVVEP
jgi:hypothetical protein